MKTSVSAHNDLTGTTITLTAGPLSFHLHLHGDVDDKPVVSGGFHYQQGVTP